MLTAITQGQTSTPRIAAGERLTQTDLVKALDRHRTWLDSRGEDGARADFSRQTLGGADLIDARLQDSLLVKTDLRGADLMLADLRRANLLGANLEGASLLGTRFQHANLQGAVLQGATGLLCQQFAGANVFGAVFPAATSPSEDLKQVRAVAGRARWFLVLMLLLNGLTWLRILTTQDARLLTNSSALPFARFQTTLPFIPFYLFGPVMILALYICFHLHLQRLWEGVAQMPAIFPDGGRLDMQLPGFARRPARLYFPWLQNTRSPLAFLEDSIALALLYWVTPATLLLFWGRYLTVEDLRGTTLHVLLFAAGVSAALYFPRAIAKGFESEPRRHSIAEEPSPHKNAASIQVAALFAMCLSLLLLSAGTILGQPHGYRETALSNPPGIRAWAADVLWLLGYNPFAQLNEVNVSTKPPGWTGRDDQISSVKGASLNQLRLCYLQAYGAFLVKARLWRSDLRNAYLSEADLRQANLRQADLQFAVLDHARLTGGNLPDADLRNAKLDRADLRQANLTAAALSGATLLDATLDGANLYESDLRMTSLQRASFKQADLREANLENANLAAANLQGAYLISSDVSFAQLNGADLSQAILTDAKLRQSDLSGSVLHGAILSGADLKGANLQGVDLRGALGITASQVCSAANRREVQMDDDLQQDVANLCGNKP